MTVEVRFTDDVGEIVLNRPDKLNALSLDLVRDLVGAVDEVAARTDLRVVVVRGAGRSFCSGLDLDMMSQGMPEDFFPLQEKAFTTLERMPAIVVARIHGHCLGGGLQFALACDIRIATEDAVFGLPASLEGLVPGVAGWRLPRFVGTGRAMRLALLGKPVSAAEALDIGLVDHLVPDEGFDEAAREIVRQYAEVPPLAAAGVKTMIRSAFDVTFDEAFGQARTLVDECLADPGIAVAKQAWQQRRGRT